ncbi:MAG TPA: sodium:proton antiporter [Kosmotogaceae bacterium]|nr:MAG: Uncharacterized protein XE05_0553 [Thermotogales bacterium 46_20]HAA85667.1 sodium:proton antiporter [Kosmotogaceae bacterium]
MIVTGLVIFFAGIILVVAGTIRAVCSKTLIIALHFIGISDTVGLSLLVISAVFLGLVSVHAGVFLVLVLIVGGPLVSHVIAKAYLRSGRE